MAKRAKGKRIALTPERLDRILQEKQRTQVGSIALLKAASDIPRGLSPHMIERWLSGGTKTALKHHYDFVINAYQSLSDNCQNTRRPIKGTVGRIKVTDEMRQQVAQIHNSMPANYLNSAPEKFTPVQMCHLINGRNKTIPVAIWGFLQEIKANAVSAPNRCGPETLGQSAIYQTKEDFPLTPSLRSKRNYKLRHVPGTEYVEITDAIYETLHAELRRTRVTPNTLLKHGDDAPRGLQIHTVSNWFSGKILSAEKHYLEYILKCYADLPDAPTPES
tara:strand:- start:459 stop:1286 length:828 start_codon:yes stop_codon:yes gene_type:complete